MKITEENSALMGIGDKISVRRSSRSIVLSILCSIALLLSVTGCSSRDVISDVRKRDQTVVINYSKCKTKDEEQQDSGGAGSPFTGEWVYWNQENPNWSGRDSGDTYWHDGCGVTSVAMVLASYAKDTQYNPDKVGELLGYGKYLPAVGKVASYVNAHSDTFHLKAEDTGSGSNSWKEDWDRVISVCKNGGCVVVGSDSIGTSSGCHYVVIRKVENGTVSFANPWGGCEQTCEESFAKSAGYSPNSTQTVWFEPIGGASTSSGSSSTSSSGSSSSSSSSSGSSSSSSSSSRPVTQDADGKGFTIEIPEEYQAIEQNYGYGSNLECLIDGITTSAGWVQWGVEGNGGEAGEVARRWDKEGRPYIADALPAVEGRALVVVKEIYGKPGDYVDVNYKDGHVLHAMIFDIQGATDDAAGVQPFSKYGHAVAANTCNVLEWYSDCSEDKHLWQSGQNPCNIKGFEWVTGTVASIHNTDGVYTGAAGDATGAQGEDPTEEDCNAKYEKDHDNNVQVNPGEAAAVDPSTTARLQWLYGDSGVPQTDAENQKWLETFDVVVRLPGGGQGTWSLTMHKKLKAEVQAMFQDIYNNTDYTIDPSDGNSLRDWNLEAGNYVSPQTNSNHAYGLAIDINVAHNNGTGSCNVGTTYNPGSDPLSLTTDCKVMKIIKNHGFFWGGDWSDPCDPMHIAYTDH